MHTIEELKRLLLTLPDADPEFVHYTAFLFEKRGLVNEAISWITDAENPTLDSVVRFRLEYCSTVEYYDENNNRIPVDPARLALTSGMRDIVANMVGKTFKSYQFAPAGSATDAAADCNVRFNLGQHAVDLNCYNFAFDLDDDVIELGAIHCERMNLHDDFRAWTDNPWHAYAVGERITGIDLITDTIEVVGCAASYRLPIDIGIAIHTTYATYTFAKMSWVSTDIHIAVDNDISVPFEAEERIGTLIDNANNRHTVSSATRTITKLA